MPEPIKRHEALQDLSRDHHQGLLLCFKIRQGLKKDVDPERIMAYVRHFYHGHLVEHFRKEEKVLFPVIGNEHPMVQKAINQHRQLKRLGEEEPTSEVNLRKIETELKAHIRFEERELFNEIQDLLGEEKLQELNNRLHQVRPESEGDWEDAFWS